MNWILWNKETDSIIRYGYEKPIRDAAEAYNTFYQTDAFVARQYSEPIEEPTGNPEEPVDVPSTEENNPL